MSCKTKEGKDLVLLAMRLNWQGQTGLHLTLSQDIGGVVMAIGHVDELIGDLIQFRDLMEQENAKAKAMRGG